jgi:dTDP-6-deoxy-L-talose 4-dehydrogenase (NAD+)
MKIAVTGATGFLGKYVVSELLERGVQPIILVRPQSAVPEHWAHLPIARFDLASPPDNAFAQLGKPETLIHLAWSGLPNYKSLHHFETELPLQYHFLSHLIRGGLSHLVVSGTCFEYGMQSGCLAETVEAKPTNPYGFAKDSLRRQLGYLAEAVPFDLTWTRLFYLYGLGQAPSSLYTQLSAAVARGEKRFDMSGGEQLRDYLPVEEASRALCDLAMGSSRPEIVNICSGTPVSVRRLVEEWAEQRHWQIQFNLGFYPYPDYEPMAFWGNAEKLKKILLNKA